MLNVVSNRLLVSQPFSSLALTYTLTDSIGHDAWDRGCPGELSCGSKLSNPIKILSSPPLPFSGSKLLVLFCDMFSLAGPSV